MMMMIMMTATTFDDDDDIKGSQHETKFDIASGKSKKKAIHLLHIPWH